MAWIKTNGGVIKRDGKVAISLNCCCSARCCNRILPATLYLTIYNFAETDPMTGTQSSCCADGVTIPLNFCQGNTSGTVPSRWSTIDAGETFCQGTGRKIWAEVTCALPLGGGITDSGIVLTIAILNPTDNTDCNSTGAFGMTCLPPDTPTGQQLGPDSLTSTCTPLYWEFGNPGFTRFDNPGDCCDDNTTVGYLTFTVTEDPPP